MNAIAPCRSIAAMLLALAAAIVSAEAADPCDLEQGPAVTLGAVTDAWTATLADGAEVRLMGALPPETPPFWRRAEAWPPAVAAQQGLEALLAEAEAAELRFAGPRRDRHDRWLAHLFVLRGGERLWVQGRLVEQGLARAFSLPQHSACARALQALESEARMARRGLWRWRAYDVVPAAETDTLLRRINSFQIVEGRVYGVSETRTWTFLNFDADWRTDFTVAIAAADRRRFDGSDIDLAALEDARVRVRGWIESWNGPVVKATHPEEIELLAPSGD